MGERTSTSATEKKHLVIGAGLTGLAMAAALKRHGIAYDHVDRDTGVGGNWRHGVYETVHIISSKKTTEYHDYPMPEDYPDFPSADQMLRYFQSYAEETGVLPNIEFETNVTHVRAATENEGGRDRWAVDLKRGDKIETRIYGGVVICNGHHWDMRWPEYPGQFDGESIHTKQYKTPEQLKGKRVLVVGGGNSACDVAVEAARFAKESHISLRRGYWFIPKTVAGMPSVELLKPWMPGWLQSYATMLILRIFVGRYSSYGLEEPKHRVFTRHPTINSQLLYFLKHGRITPHKDISQLDGKHVFFKDGSSIEVDMIVYGTGFHVSVPFVEEGIIKWNAAGYPDLIGGLCSKEHRNFYVVGIGQPRYGAGPLVSRGAEALARMIKVQPKLKLPLGEVLARLGTKPMRTYLLDPHAAIRRAKLGAWLAPWLPWIERRFLLKEQLPSPPNGKLTESSSG